MELDEFESLVARRRSSLLCDSERPVSTELVARLCRTVFAAPNHKHTVPWRISVIAGEARRTLGEAVSGDLVSSATGTQRAKIEKTRTKYLRAPVIVVAGCKPDDDPIRHREDTFAVAAGVGHLLLGATAAGLNALWSSPPVPVAPRTNSLAGFEPDAELIGLIYLGWPTATPRTSPRPEPAVTWRGVAQVGGG